MSYTDGYFIRKDISNHPFLFLLFIIVAVGFLVSYHFSKKEEDAIRVVFLDYTIPLITSPVNEKSLEAALAKTEEMLKSRDNDLHEAFAIMRENYQIYLSKNKQPCAYEKEEAPNPHLEGLEDVLKPKPKRKPKVIARYEIKNPYTDTIAAVKQIKAAKSEEARAKIYLPLPPLDMRQWCSPI